MCGPKEKKKAQELANSPNLLIVIWFPVALWFGGLNIHLKLHKMNGNKEHT